MQNERIVMRDVVEPNAKARAFVKEVIVMEGPAWRMAFLILSFTVKSNGV